ncbi:MAG: glycoside hydrolase family 16 protein [Acidobacteriaceae bacterium]
MFRWMCLFCIPLLLISPLASAQSSLAPAANHAADGRTLIWSDEFNGLNGSPPDPKKWVVVSNDSGYGNNELEYYTNRPANVVQQDGSLTITARRERYVGKDGKVRLYTSGRIESHGRFAFKYGRAEARIQIPAGQGIWPAFWMLGNNYTRVGWPKCGEIDIMENVGYEPSKVHGSLHGPGYSGSHPLTGVYTLPGGERFSAGYHIFAVEWAPRSIRFYVDGSLYETQTPKDLPPGKHWVFNHPFFLILNLAVGGNWPGNPDATTKFPQSMKVDYVRVYRLKRHPKGQIE